MEKELLCKLSGLSPNLAGLFGQWQELLGFQIGWVLPDLHRTLCSEEGLDPANCEIIMMQAHGLTECHLHQEGFTTFLPLGKEHGFRDPAGGTLMAEYQRGQTSFKLVPHPAVAGEMFEVAPGIIHAFYAEDGGMLTAIGLVSPKIRHGDKFDVLPFKLTGGPPFLAELCVN